MRIIESPQEIQQFALQQRRLGKRIGFVPTMGALHAGHTSLIDIARGQCDILIVSIFVNPLQFSAHEDLDTYPHTPETDHALCEKHGTDVLFRPTTMYSANHSTTVSVSHLTTGLCGASRPTHFNGVTTVVARLFGLVQPHLAVFGQKDFQQLAVIRQMVRDLAMPIEIIGAPIVREPDGLALSSRNAYLSIEDRKRALSISQSLRIAQETVAKGECSVSTLINLIATTLTVDRLDYVSIVDATTLEPASTLTSNTHLCIAAFLGNTRLIDNCPLGVQG